MQYQPLSSLQQILNNSTSRFPSPTSYPDLSKSFTPANNPFQPIAPVQIPQFKAPGVTPMGVQVAQPQAKSVPTVAPNSQVAQSRPTQQTSNAYGSFPSILGSLTNASTQSNPSSRTAQSSLLGQAQNPSPANPAIGGLYGIAQTQSPAVTAAEADYNKFAQENPYMVAAQHNPNVAADIASGRDSLLGQTFAAVSAAKQAAINNALAAQGQQITAGQAAGNLGLTAQGQQITAANEAGSLGNTAQGQAISGLGTAAGLAQPVQVSPANSLISPQGGDEVYQGLGLTGLAIANQNAAQGADYQKKATDLSTTLNSIDGLTPTIASFLINSGLNDNRSPWVNQSVKSYIAQNQNSGNAITLQQYMNALKTYQSSIIASSGLTPTEVTNTVLGTDPSNLSIVDLIPFVNNLKNEGHIRLKPLQDAANLSYGSNTKGSVSPYVGNTAIPSTQSSYAPNSQTPANQYIGDNDIARGLIGVGINTGSTIVGGLAGWAKSMLER